MSQIYFTAIAVTQSFEQKIKHADRNTKQQHLGQKIVPIFSTDR